MRSLRIGSRRRSMAGPRRSPWRLWRSSGITAALILLAIGILPNWGPDNQGGEQRLMAREPGAMPGFSRVTLPLPNPGLNATNTPNSEQVESPNTDAADVTATVAPTLGNSLSPTTVVTQANIGAAPPSSPPPAEPTMRPAIGFAAEPPPASAAIVVSNPEPTSAQADSPAETRPRQTAVVTPTPSSPDQTDAQLAPAMPEPPIQTTTVSPLEKPEAHKDWVEVKVKSGDSLSSIFQRLDLGNQQMYAVLHADSKAKDFQRLHPGQQLRFLLGDDKRLEEMVYQRSLTDILRVVRDGDRLRVESQSREFETRTRYARARIENSLFEAGQRAGLSDSITMQVAEIFAWDIDFALDIRRGDRFRVLYEEKYLDGTKVKDGAVLAVEFSNNGKTYRAIRYTDPKGRSGYYAPDGRSLRKAFLRAPVSFTRISSRFSMGRYHPVLHRIRAHKGVDYAAARGTPVHATGNGKVVFKGRKGGYGNTVILRHGSSYSTLYAHLSRYPSGLRKGQWVKQGQVIGYVGSTGLASGPHLHYEFRVGGKHRNPLTVKLPAAEPIPKAYLADFKDHSRRVLRDLDRPEPTTVALNQVD